MCWKNISELKKIDFELIFEKVKEFYGILDDLKFHFKFQAFDYFQLLNNMLNNMLQQLYY